MGVFSKNILRYFISRTFAFVVAQISWRVKSQFLCLWYRASLIYTNNWQTTGNTKQSNYYSTSSLYMFRVSTTPISSTQNCNYSLRYCAATSLQRGQVCPHWRGVPEAVVTVLCTPHDGCGWHPKHVEWTCRIINRLLCVASRWTIIIIKSQYYCKGDQSHRHFVLLKRLPYKKAWNKILWISKFTKESS